MSGRDVAAGEVVGRAINRAYERLVANESELRLGDDPEPVHQARVAARRLRSDLKTFEQFLDPRWAADLRAELRWLGSELGAVRDLDVQRDRLRDHASQLPPPEADAARRVIRRLDADRVAEKANLITMLNQPRYAQLRAQLRSAAAEPAFSKAARKPGKAALAAVVRGRWKQVRNAVQILGDNPPDEALHAVRVRAKRGRYAAEACVPVFGKRARRLARAMANVQNLLGEHHDAVVASTWLAKTAHECTPAEAYAIGMLAQIERDAARTARAEFPAAWRLADTQRVHGWL